MRTSMLTGPRSPLVAATGCAGVLGWQAFYWPKRLTERVRLLSAASTTDGSLG
ncbi:hypothetical protein [Kribbella deserti]|uniref:Uncharacterized protein n=1 Tax=Kribbella deserti TaxID=1926257 RepID=A0ABV6QFM8_9ACTN